MDTSVLLVGVSGLIIGLIVGGLMGMLIARDRVPAAPPPDPTPMLDALDRLRRRVDEAERLRGQDQAGLRTEITEHLRTMQATTSDLRTQTAQLSAALGRTDVRGRWGEAHLRRIVEAAGMLDRVHFVEQSTVTVVDGAGTQRPDLVIDLGAGRQVVVDAKVPLTSLLEAEACDDPDERAAWYARHAADVASHVDRLAAKEYWRQYDGSIDLVVLFLPAESMLGLALTRDPGLLDRAFARRVVVATPTTLLALLRTVATVWRHEAVATNAREIQVAGQELYDRLRKALEHLSALGSSIGRTVDGYNQFVGSLESRALVSARRLSDLGVDDRPLPMTEPLTRIPRTPRSEDADPARSDAPPSPLP